MSSCEKYQELISRMVDGDLSPEEKHDLSDHVETCPSCSALFQAFFAISKQIEEDLEEPPLDLRDSVMAEIQRAEIRRRNRIPTIIRGVLSAAACLAVISGIYLGVSLTQGKHLTTAASGADAAPAEKAVAAEAAALPEEEAVQDRAAGAKEEAAEAPMLQANAPALAAEEPAAAPEERTVDVQAAEPAADEADDEADAEGAEDLALEEALPPEEDENEWLLSNWDLALLRELLGGTPVDLSREAMEPYLMGKLQVENRQGSWTVYLYERNGVLYYLDPTEEAVYQASLTPQELLDFLRG